MKKSILRQYFLYFLWFSFGLGAVYHCVQADPMDKEYDIQQSMDRIVQSYREIIVLLAEQEDKEQQESKAFVVGKIIYHENIRRLNRLESMLARNPIVLKHFLSRIEQRGDFWDADILVFKSLLESLLEAMLQESSSDDQLRKRLKDAIKILHSIQKLYDDEVTDIFSRFGTRSLPVKRKSWDEYLAFIKSHISRKLVLESYDIDIATTVNKRSIDQKDKPAKKAREIFGLRFPEKTLLLTFDDGPHKKYTPKILEILKKYKLKPVFFHVGNNLETQDQHNKSSLSKTAEISKQLNKEGILLANHSYSHPVMVKLEKQEIGNQIEKTNKLLKKITGDDTIFFRAPYGARNNVVLAELKAKNLQSMMWNIDSQDWADPIPKSIAKRVLNEVDKQRRGIILFHDIQSQTVEALPLVLDALIAKGYQFAAWNGEGFSVDGKSIESLQAEVTQSSLYRESWAVVIGIDSYQHWPKLNYAVNDAMAVKDKLINKFGFKREKIFTLLNEEASRDNILKLFHDKLADPKLIQAKDRVFVFYAGHGATRHLPSGRDLGYIIPVEAHIQNYYGESISMSNIGDISEALAAKHLLFVMDSCYSGLALLRGVSRVDSVNYIRDNISRMARQMFTAGGADQQVADSGPNGHSVFTWMLLQGLEGKGDLNKDHYITASELAAYASPIVSSISLQTPAFGNLVGSEGGDFIFELERQPQFLNELSEQLDEQELSLITQIDALKDKIQNKRERNLKLKRELLSVKELLEEPIEEAPDLSAIKLNEEGLRLYKEKKHEEALTKFIAAAKTDPTYSEAINNAGFLYYRLEQYEKSVYWLKKTVVLEDGRAVAWLNLGDAYFKLGSYKDARIAFKKYLSLKASAKPSNAVKEKLGIIEEHLKRSEM